MSDNQDIIEKQTFFQAIIDAIVDAGYCDPGYYVEEYHGEPVIFDAAGTPRQSLACDSPTAIICDFARVLEEDN